MNYKITTSLMQHLQDAVEKLNGVKVAALFMDMGTCKKFYARIEKEAIELVEETKEK